MREEEGQRMLFREEHPKPKRGELWKLGSHLLMCGDSTDMGQVRFLTGGGEMREAVHRSAIRHVLPVEQCKSENTDW